MRAALALGEQARLRDLEAYLLLGKGELQPALEAAGRATALDPELASGHHTLGQVLTHLGRIRDADRAFARAAELDPGSYFRPYRLQRKEFDQTVEKALASLPEQFRRHLENGEVAVEAVPFPALIRDGLEHDLLGLYLGVTISANEWELPDRILLYQRNLENVSPDRRTLLREIRDTVLHEVGHHLGMEEDQLEAIEEEPEDA